MRDYVYHVDPAAEKQFSAMTIVLPDETRFIAFRGTDDNIVAWKEDFNMGSARRRARADGRGELSHARGLAL